MTKSSKLLLDHLIPTPFRKKNLLDSSWTLLVQGLSFITYIFKKATFYNMSPGLIKGGVSFPL